MQAASKRILSIDILRGIVMVVMALDHTRDFFSGFKFQPTDLDHASSIMFFTRWITHFCAPVFVFLSGVSAYLSLGRHGSKPQAFSRLLSRGLWLIVLEVTLVRLGWTFDFHYSIIFLQVIWAIGVSMCVLSLLIFLPRWLILAFGLIMIFGHNAFDNLQPAAGAAVLWDFLHVQGPISYGHGNTIMIFYPLIPWIGVMAAGYCMGYVFTLEEQRRNNLLFMIGGAAILLFVVLRGINLYGDPSPWAPRSAWWRTLLSFLNCTKYPPSLLYLLMTLGPAIVAMPLLERLNITAGDFFIVYGRVPLFYYILHIYLIHGLAIALQAVRGGEQVTLFTHPGYSLPMVYLFWSLVVLSLYLPCLWFMQVKANNKKWWLSYL